MPITTKEIVKKLLAITDTNMDDRISALIPMVEAHYLNIRRKPWDLDESGNIVYPIGAEFTAIQMISYNLKMLRKQHLSSESLGDYSESFIVPTSAYPQAIMCTIKQYIR